MTHRQMPFLPVLGRVMLAALFLLSGFDKLMDPASTKAYIASAGLPMADIAYLVAVVVEVGLGLALLLGYQTRIAAAVIAAFTVAAAIGFHADFADGNQMNHFMKNIATAGGLLYVVAYGAPHFSLDALRARRGKTA